MLPTSTRSMHNVLHYLVQGSRSIHSKNKSGLISIVTGKFSHVQRVEQVGGGNQIHTGPGNGASMMLLHTHAGN